MQDAFNGKFPNLQVRASGDFIVFTDPELFEKQEDRASYRGVIKGGAMQTQLCTFGFKKARLESSRTASKEEFDLGCPATAQSKPELGKADVPATSTEPTQAAQKQSQTPGSDGEISGRIFLITKAGDLKPARLAQVVLLAGSDAETPATVYYNKRLENMKASYQSLVAPGDASCRAELLVFSSSLKSTLQWGEANGKRDQIRIIESDEEGAFHFPKIPPGSYTLVAWGHAGANDAYWENDLQMEPGQSITFSLIGRPHLW